MTASAPATGALPSPPESSPLSWVRNPVPTPTWLFVQIHLPAGSASAIGRPRAALKWLFPSYLSATVTRFLLDRHWVASASSCLNRSPIPERPLLTGSACVDDLADLAAAAREGNCRAVRTLIAAIGPAMLRAIRQVMGTNHTDVEGLLQEASLNALEGLKRFSGNCSVLHFACRVAVLTAMNARRRQAATKRSWRWLPTVETW